MNTKDVKRSGVAEKPARRRRPNPAETVYIPPKPFNRRRLLIRLATTAAVVLALLFGMAIFFKVEVVNVTGMKKYTAWDVREASQIRDGENLLTVSQAQASGRIMTKLPYVKSVRVRIKLPNAVNIEITEMDVVYAIQTDQGAWWLMSAEGKLVEATAIPDGYTKVIGVQITDPQAGGMAQAAEVPEETREDGTAIPITVRESEKLRAAVEILGAMEAQGILGGVTKVDVTDMGDLQLWLSTRYQVLLGDSSRISYKIQTVVKAIDQMSDYQSGTLDASYTMWPDKVGFTPFDQ